MKITQHLKELLYINRQTYWVVITYGVAVAVLSLITPIAVQTLVNIVSFGSLLQPLVMLTLVVFVGLTMVSCFRIFQAIIVETIQQRLFVKTGLKLARELPHVSYETVENTNMLRSVNYFFEIQTIQKAIAMLLVTGLDLSFMGLISMILLAFYHPLLLAFDILLLIGLLIVILFPFRQALKYAVDESDAKHELASWLEEIVQNLILFKTQSHDEYAFEVADTKLIDYVKARKFHFKYILRHLIGMNMLYVVANASLLGIGGYLVIREQLSLGQLVASELVVNVLLYNFLRIGFYLENFYDLLASSYKMGTLLNLPKDTKSSTKLETELPDAHGYNISVAQLCYHDYSHAIFDNLSFKINSGDKVALIGDTGKGKSILLDLITGLRNPSSGIIKINDILLKEYPTKPFQKEISLIREVELFSGSIYDNLVLQNQTTSTNQVYQLLEALNIEKTIESLPQGLNTIVNSHHLEISKTELNKLMLIRGFLSQPQLFIIDGMLDSFCQQDLNLIMQQLELMPSTIIIATARKDIAEKFSTRIEL